MQTNKTKPAQCYLCFSEDYPQGIVLVSLKDVTKLKKPVTKQAFPIELKSQLEAVIKNETQRIEKFH